MRSQYHRALGHPVPLGLLAHFEVSQVGGGLGDSLRGFRGCPLFGSPSVNTSGVNTSGASLTTESRSGLSRSQEVTRTELVDTASIRAAIFRFTKDPPRTPLGVCKDVRSGDGRRRTMTSSWSRSPATVKIVVADAGLAHSNALKEEEEFFQNRTHAGRNS